ncbi:MAG: hypothetical protein A2284_02530 [Deltaproteobacteria bacterium RIFOXYA12_FULL_61_11]|nr:MAG: hypothetical protein A2284_02530 [Deltaproteobacteria bacterium RIFOXYA12_FULL_61_11]
MSLSGGRVVDGRGVEVHRIINLAVSFKRLVHIADAVASREKLTHGIGATKAFGYGVMIDRRILGRR